MSGTAKGITPAAANGSTPVPAQAKSTSVSKTPGAKTRSQVQDKTVEKKMVQEK